MSVDILEPVCPCCVASPSRSISITSVRKVSQTFGLSDRGSCRPERTKYNIYNISPSSAHKNAYRVYYCPFNASRRPSPGRRRASGHGSPAVTLTFISTFSYRSVRRLHSTGAAGARSPQRQTRWRLNGTRRPHESSRAAGPSPGARSACSRTAWHMLYLWRVVIHCTAPSSCVGWWRRKLKRTTDARGRRA